MSLKPDRFELETRIDQYMTAAASRGGCASISTAASGVANDNAVSLASYQANPSGKFPLGILLNDVVSKDLTKTHLNFYKEETQVGQKVSLLVKGTVTTDMIYPGASPTAGATAYLGMSGYLTPTQATLAPAVGRFETSKDEDGFAKVTINLP